MFAVACASVMKNRLTADQLGNRSGREDTVVTLDFFAHRPGFTESANAQQRARSESERTIENGRGRGDWSTVDRITQNGIFRWAAAMHPGDFAKDAWRWREN